MITVGLIKELLFISKALRVPVRASLSPENLQCGILIDIKEQILSVSYLGYHIWTESLDEATSMFGVESCDTLAKIVSLIDSGDDKVWRTLVFTDK